MDPNEPGSPHLVNEMESYALQYISSADIDDVEAFPPLYDPQLKEFTIHSELEDSYKMSVTKFYPDKLRATYGDKINVRDFYSSHPFHPTDQWLDVDEEIDLPTFVPFLNSSKCGGNHPITYVVTRYDAYHEMAPIRRNPSSIFSKHFKLDSRPVSVKMSLCDVGHDSDHSDADLADCKINKNEMKYNPIRVKFTHVDKQTSKRKLLWHEDDLQTKIEYRFCAAWNEDIGIHGAWDKADCTTVLTEQASTVCECSTFSTVVVMAEMVETPSYDEAKYEWLDIVKYMGYFFSCLGLLVFVVVLSISPSLWDMFHLLRLNSGITYLICLVFNFAAEFETLREDRHVNIALSACIQYWTLTTCFFLCCESFATFRAVAYGIVGGKTSG